MKTFLNLIVLVMLFSVVIICTSQVSFSQGFDEPECAPPPAEQGGSVPPIRPVIIYCVDSSLDGLDPIPLYLVNPFPKIIDYYEKATFNQFPFTGGTILTRPNQRPFRSRFTYCPEDTFITDSVFFDILAQVDSVYDVGQYDYDCDGYVDFAVFTLLNFSARGRAYVGIEHQSADVNRDGDPVKISLTYRRGTTIRMNPGDAQNGIYDYLALWFHEMGHSLFYFKDMEHDGTSLYHHYGLGDFDIMSGDGFDNVPSPYNPWYCWSKGWGNFRKVTSNLLNLEMNDFYQGGETLYVDSLIRPGAYYDYLQSGGGRSYQKFFVTYHEVNQGNEWTYYWPVNEDLGGVMIWHVSGQKDYVSNYEHSYLKPIDIEAAHGKFTWDTTGTNLTNTMVPNPVSGFDSLEIRKIGADPSDGRVKELQGPYYHRDWGSESIPFVPNSGKEFTPTSNPSSALYHSDFYSAVKHPQNVFSDFAVKSILRSDNITTLSIYVNAPPAPPSNLQLSTLNQHPHLVWDANTEPDFAKYYISRNGAVVDSTTDTSWTDIEAIVIGQSPVNATYFLTARDSSYNVSDPGDSVGARVRWEATKKPSSQSEPKHFSINDNYPNPFNPSTSFEVNLSDDAYLHIVVMDMLGREVYKLANNEYDSGNYRFMIDGSRLPSGIYFCNVQIFSSSSATLLQSRVLKIVLAK